MRTKDFKFFRLKAAMADLIECCGSQKRAGEIAGVSQQLMSRVAIRDDATMLSIPAKLALELDCGKPIVTQAEAELLGHRLVAEPRPAVPGCAGSATAGLASEFAELMANYAARTADGVFSRADAMAIDRDLAEVIRVAEAYRGMIAAHLAGGGA